MSNLQHCVALSLLPLSWRVRIGQSLRDGDPPGDLLDRLLSEATARAAAATARARSRVADVIARSDRAGISLIPWGDARYPVLLAATADPPPLLWSHGQSEVLQRPAVAIVGSRAGSTYALTVAERLAADLASRGIAVVSGMARGVDSAAHRGALSTGTTVAVFGSGADVIYPPEHRDLARQIRTAGAIVSELAPGTPPRQQFFPLRNRIVSGLTRAVVVVEAGERSGSLITARCALDQGREVLAVPGNVLTGRNRGGHALIKDGAKIVETADDILEELRGGLLTARDPNGPAVASKQAAPVPEEPILAALAPGEPSDLDALAERTGLAVPQLLPRLLALELEGAVARIGGGRFVRVDRSC